MDTWSGRQRRGQPEIGSEDARLDIGVVVDSVSLDLVRGAEVDYVESLGGAAFRSA